MPFINETLEKQYITHIIQLNIISESLYLIIIL